MTWFGGASKRAQIFSFTFHEPRIDRESRNALVEETGTCTRRTWLQLNLTEALPQFLHPRESLSSIDGCGTLVLSSLSCEKATP